MEISVTVLPPLAVLKAQEGFLARHTRGMLQAKLSSVENGKLVQHQLDLIAPSLNFYRHRLLTATHDRDMLYPVTIAAEAFNMGSASPIGMGVDPPSVRMASTDGDLIDLVGKVLQSAGTRALIASLIARINEQTNLPGNGIDKPSGGQQ